MKKKLFIFAGILILCVLLLPLPEKIEKTYNGVNINTGENVKINAEMRYLKFLVLKNKLYGKITLETEDEKLELGDDLAYTGLTPANNEDKTVHMLTGWHFNPNTYVKDEGKDTQCTEVEGFEAAIVYLSRDFNKILVYHQPKKNGETEPRYYTVGDAENDNTEETKTYFAGFYR